MSVFGCAVAIAEIASASAPMETACCPSRGRADRIDFHCHSLLQTDNPFDLIFGQVIVGRQLLD
jgi:hypothetical protein